MGMESLVKPFNQAKPFLSVLFLQLAHVGNAIISKYALNKGMNQYVVVAYRSAIATLVISPFAFILDRKTRPQMTLPIFIKILLLGLEAVLTQNLYYAGVKRTSATFATAMLNVLPAFAFIMAWIFRFEKVSLSKVHSVVRIVGTVVTIGGAMIMTLVTGPVLYLPWTQHNTQYDANSTLNMKQDHVMGALMIGISCFLWSGFIILQAITLKSYQAPLSLTSLVSCMGTIEATIFAIAVEKGSTTAWSIHLDSQLLTAVYGGVIVSALGYYVQGVVMGAKGPVFVTAFSPLRIVIVAILSSFILSEMLNLGRVIGAIVIIFGIYLVLWGKTNNQPSPEMVEAVAITGDQLKAVGDECPSEDYVVMVKA